mgnify:CR=1 FL=1
MWRASSDETPSRGSYVGGSAADCKSRSCLALSGISVRRRPRPQNRRNLRHFELACRTTVLVNLLGALQPNNINADSRGGDQLMRTADLNPHGSVASKCR